MRQSSVFRRLGFAAVIVCVQATVIGPPTAANEMSCGDGSSIGPSLRCVSWQGQTATGANTAHAPASGEPCGDLPATRCDERVLHVDVPESSWGVRPGGIAIRVFGYEDGANFDIFVYRMKPGGGRGSLVAQTVHLADNNTTDVGRTEESTSVLHASGDYLVQVVFANVVNSSYTGEVRFLPQGEWSPRNGVEALNLACNSDITNGVTSNGGCENFVGLVPSWDGLTLSSQIKFEKTAAHPLPTVLQINGLQGPRGGLGVVPGYAYANYAIRGSEGSCGYGGQVGLGFTTNLEHPRGPGGDPTCAKGHTHIFDRDWEIRDAQTFLGRMVDYGISDPERLGVDGGSNGGAQAWMLATSIPWKSPAGQPLQLAAAYASYTWTDAQHASWPNGRASDHIDQSASHEHPFGVPRELFGAVIGGSSVFMRQNLTDPSELHSFNPAWLAFVAKGEPYDSSDVAGVTADKLAAVMRNKGAYHADDYFEAVRAGKVEPVPILALQGWQDQWPAVESLQMYRKLKAADPDYPIWLAFSDVERDNSRGGQQNAHNGGVIWQEARTIVNERVTAFRDAFLLNDHGEVTFPRVWSFQTDCLPADEGPPPLIEAESWDSIASARPDLLAADERAIHTTWMPPRASQEAPVSNGACFKTSAPLPESTWSEPVPAGGLTLLGLSELSVDYQFDTGDDATVSAKLWDVDPGGLTRTLVEHGIYRLAGGEPAGTIRFKLSGNHYRFEYGHTVALEISQTDVPGFRPDNLPSTMTFTSPSLTMPTLEVNG